MPTPAAAFSPATGSLEGGGDGCGTGGVAGGGVAEPSGRARMDGGGGGDGGGDGGRRRRVEAAGGRMAVVGEWNCWTGPVGWTR